MIETFKVLNNIIVGLLLIFIIIKVYDSYTTNTQINYLITEHYEKLKINFMATCYGIKHIR